MNRQSLNNHFSWTILLLWVFSHSSILGPLSAQEEACRGVAGNLPLTMIRESNEVCADCIEIRRDVTLGEEDGPAYIEMPDSKVLRDGSGRYWVLFGEGAKVFSPEGTFLQEVGGEGEGPGEFITPTEMLADSDGRVHIYDGELSRVTTFNPDLTLSGTVPVPGLVKNTLLLPKHAQYVANMMAFPAGLMGRSLHVMDAMTHEPHISFAIAPEGGDLVTSFDLALGRNGEILAANHDIYAISAWSTSGQGQKCYLRKGLFEPRPIHDIQVTRPGEMPQIYGFVADIHVDSEALLWVSVWRPKENWKDGIIRVERPGLPPRFTRASAEAVYDNVIEVIDLARSIVVARTVMTTGPFVVGFLGDRAVYGTTYTGNGAPLVRVSRIRFTSHDSLEKE